LHEKLSNYAKLLKGHDDYLLELDKIEKLCDLLGINFYEVQLEIKHLSESHITKNRKMKAHDFFSHWDEILPNNLIR
jgi:hypothetical protein